MPEMRNYVTAVRLATVVLFTLLAAMSAAPARAPVSGRVQGGGGGGRSGLDLSDEVISLDGRGPRGAAPARPEMALDARQFRPRVLIVPAGTTVQFPNLDPFNHNVFSGGA